MRPLIVALVFVLAVLQFRLWVADGGFREVWRLEARVEERTEENRRLAERNAALTAEVLDLKSGLAAAEERARSDLGMVLPDESFYQIVPYDAAAHAKGEAGLERPAAPPQQDVEGAAAAVSAFRSRECEHVAAAREPFLHRELEHRPARTRAAPFAVHDADAAAAARDGRRDEVLQRVLGLDPGEAVQVELRLEREAAAAEP